MEEIRSAFAALSSGQRLDILETLQEQRLQCTEPDSCDFTKQCCTVGEIAQALDVTPATASHHLRRLRQANLITARRQGKNVYYEARTETIHDMTKYLQRLAGDTHE